MAKPSIWDRFKLALQIFAGGLPWPWGAKAGGPFRWPAHREGRPEWPVNDYQSYTNEGFNANSLIYGALMYKARATLAAPLRAYVAVDGDEKAELAPDDHPLSQLVTGPNQYQSGPEFQQLADIYLNLSGNCYVYFPRRRSRAIPQQMWLLRPDRVRVVPQGGKLKGYLYLPEGKPPADAMPILPGDMMHVRMPNPGDPLEGLGYGLSPIAAMARSGDVDNYVTRFLKSFFERGAMPNLTLSFGIPLEDSEVARARARWMEVYGGYENWSEIAVLDNAGKVERVGLTFDEMGFTTIDERNEARILMPFGIPSILIGTRLGLMRSIHRNYEEARKHFWQDTFVPEMRLFEAEYQRFLKTDDGACVAFDFSDVPALQQNMPALVDAAYRLWTMGVPANMALPAVGLDIGEVPGGDVGYVPMNLLPAGSAMSHPEVGEPSLSEESVLEEAKSIVGPLFGGDSRPPPAS